METKKTQAAIFQVLLILACLAALVYMAYQWGKQSASVQEDEEPEEGQPVEPAAKAAPAVQAVPQPQPVSPQAVVSNGHAQPLNDGSPYRVASLNEAVNAPMVPESLE